MDIGCEFSISRKIVMVENAHHQCEYTIGPNRHQEDAEKKTRTQPKLSSSTYDPLREYVNITYAIWILWTIGPRGIRIEQLEWIWWSLRVIVHCMCVCVCVRDIQHIQRNSIIVKNNTGIGINNVYAYVKESKEGRDRRIRLIHRDMRDKRNEIKTANQRIKIQPHIQ